MPSESGLGERERCARGEFQRVALAILDFHALRSTAIAIWVRAGLPPEQTKVLARHSTITLTLDVYHKLGVDFRLEVPEFKL